MKILFVVEHFYPYVGGAEELFLNLTISLADAGYDVTVVTTQHTSSVLKNEVYCGVKISRVNCYNRFLFTVMSLPEIFKQVRNVDYIHTTSYNSAIPAFLAGFFFRKKVIITFHEVWGKLWFSLPFTAKWKLSGFYLYEQLILKLPFFKYIAVSDFTKHALIAQGIPEQKIVKIYNGLNYESLKPYHHRPPGEFTYCFFGRLGISKGIEVLLDASAKFFPLHPQARLKLIIPTYPENLLRQVLQLIEKSGISSNIDLLHNLSKADLMREVSAASCVVVPSHSEGFCFVAVESVAMGVPVISSAKGALTEVVGGHYINLDQLDSTALFEALEKAFRQEWNYKEPKQFPLKESVAGYMHLYQTFRS